VLELKGSRAAGVRRPREPLPTALSYAVSYLFIAVIWTNHHHLMRFVPEVPGMRLAAPAMT
jgi:uncharacterized membrane protein